MLRRLPTWGKLIIVLGLVYLGFWALALGLGHCDAPPGSGCI